MGTTPNNSFPYPEATGLVKDGWEDIKDLATSIDTKLGVYAAAGMSYIGSTSIGSAVSSVSVNDVFSSSYLNYKIIYNCEAFSNAVNLNLRLRVSGSDNSSSNYMFSTVNSNTPSPWWDALTTTSDTKWTIHRYTRPNGVYGVIDIYKPFATAYTSGNGWSVSPNYNRGDGSEMSASMTVNTSYTGFTIFPETGNMTGGTIKVYGYKD